jgi:hypothetical protein
MHPGLSISGLGHIQVRCWARDAGDARRASDKDFVSLLQQTRKEARVKLQGMLVVHGYITKRGNKVVDKVEDICLLISIKSTDEFGSEYLERWPTSILVLKLGRVHTLRRKAEVKIRVT